MLFHVYIMVRVDPYFIRYLSSAKKKEDFVWIKTAKTYPKLSDFVTKHIPLCDKSKSDFVSMIKKHVEKLY